VLCVFSCDRDTKGENSTLASPSGSYSGEVGEVGTFHLDLVGDGVLAVFVGSKVKENSALAKAEVTPENVSWVERSSTLLAFDKDGFGFAPKEKRFPVFRPVGIHELDFFVSVVGVGRPFGTANPSFLDV